MIDISGYSWNYIVGLPFSQADQQDHPVFQFWQMCHAEVIKPVEFLDTNFNHKALVVSLKVVVLNGDCRKFTNTPDWIIGKKNHLMDM